MDSSTVQVAMVGMTGAGKTVLISTLAMKMSQMADRGVFLAPMGENRRQTLRYVQQNWQLLNSGQWPPSTPAGELIQLQWELTTRTNSATVRFADCAGQDIKAIFGKEQFNINSLTPEQKETYKYLHDANVLIFLINMEDVLGRSPKESLENSLDIDQMFYVLNQPTDKPRKIALVFSQFDKYRDELKARYDDNLLEFLKANFPLLHGRYVQNPDFAIIPVAAVEDTQMSIIDGTTVQVPKENFSSFNLKKLISWIAKSVDELAPKLQTNQTSSQTCQSEKPTTQSTSKAENTTDANISAKKVIVSNTNTDIRPINWVLSTITFALLLISIFTFIMDKQSGSQDTEAIQGNISLIVIFGMLFFRNFLYGIKLTQVKKRIKKWEDEIKSQNNKGSVSVQVTEKLLYFCTPLYTIIMSLVLFCGLLYLLIAISETSLVLCVLPTFAIVLSYFISGFNDYFEVQKIVRSKDLVRIEERMNFLKSSAAPLDLSGCLMYIIFLCVIILAVFLTMIGFTVVQSMVTLSIISGVFCALVLFGCLCIIDEYMKSR